MRTTIKQVAERAGVSSMTVSNVLRGTVGEAAEETRARVLRAVRDLDYIPVRSSKQSRHIQTHVISVVFDEVDAASDDWGLNALRGLRQGALATGYDLLLQLRPAPDWAVGREEAQYLDRRSDGIIFVAPRNRWEVLSTLVEHEIPVVACYDTEVPPGVVYVVADDAAAARLATEHLIAQGHTKIAYFSGELKKSYFRNRRAGFDQAIIAAHLKPACILETVQNTSDNIQLADLKKILNSGATAVVCANDIYALELQALSATTGVLIPQQLSVIGMDDLSVAETVRLSSIHIDGTEIGRLAVNALIELMQGVPVEQCHRLTTPYTVARDTVAPLSRAFKPRLSSEFQQEKL